jgi:hypothetical protein
VVAEIVSPGGCTVVMFSSVHVFFATVTVEKILRHAIMANHAYAFN